MKSQHHISGFKYITIISTNKIQQQIMSINVNKLVKEMNTFEESEEKARILWRE